MCVDDVIPRNDLAHMARHVRRCVLIIQETWVENAFHDVAGHIHQALPDCASLMAGSAMRK